MKGIITGDLITVVATIAAATLATSALQPVLPLYLTSIGVSPTILGFMLSMAMVGMVFGESTGGWLADKLGIKIPLSVGTFFCAPVVFCFVLTRDISVIFLIFFIWGIVRSAIFGPSRGFVGNTAPPMQKAMFMGIYATTLAASRSLGALISGFIADGLGYNWNFYISSGIALIGGIILLAGLRKMPFLKPNAEVTTSTGLNTLLPERTKFNRKAFGFQCSVAALNFLGNGVNSFLPLLATQVVGVKATEVGILLTLGGTVNMLLLIQMGRLADRKGKKIFMILGLLVSASGLAGIAFVRSYPMLILFVIINSLGGAMFSPAAVALLSNTVPQSSQITAMGIYGACEDIGVIFGSALAGVVWTAFGPSSTFLMGTIASALGSAICLIWIKEKVSEKQ